MKTFLKTLNLEKTENNVVNIDKGVKFIMSTPDVDRMGDRVMPDWNLKDFLKNPVCLFAHDHDDIVGKWVDVKMEGVNLVGTLQFAADGTSPIVDKVRSLVMQGILKAVSIGFSSEEFKENDFGGYDLFKNSLMECSLVAVPANQNALRKSFSEILPQKEVDRLCAVNGCTMSKSFGDRSGMDAKDTEPKSIKKNQGYKMKTLAERIKELQELLVAKRDSIKEIAEKEDATDADMEIMTGLTAEVEDLEKKLDHFERAEKAVAVKVKDTKQDIQTKLDKKTNREKGEFATKLFVAIAKAHVAGVSPVEMAEKTYGGDKEVMAFVKAVSNPADTTTPGWAAELVQQGYGEFLETLYPVTVYGRVAGTPLYFGKYGSLIIPAFSDASNISGEFIAEGAPIPVKQGAFTSKTLTPKKLGVITTFTREILTKSTPAVEVLVRNAIVQDTAKAIDSAFLDDQPESAIRPAGLLDPTSTGAANINPSVGATVTDILADVKGVFGRLANVQLGQKGNWMMNPTTVLGLSTKQLATGQFAFEEVRGGTFAGHPIISSTNVPADVVYFVDDMALVKGSEIAPEFSVSNQATLVMDTEPEHIIDGGSPTTKNVRSMYQTDSTALRFVLGLDWAIIRQGGVQALTGVAW